MTDITLTNRERVASLTVPSQTSTHLPSARDLIGAVERHEITTREAWLQLRMRDLTASDVANVSGVGYRSAKAVWAEKRGLIAGTADNPILQRGRWFESAIWAAVKDRHPDWEKVIAAKIYLRSSSLRLGATPDALAVDPARDGIVLLQGKIVAKPIFNRDWIVDNTGADPVVPLGYQLQTLTETMLVEAYCQQPIYPVLAALVVDTWTAELHMIPITRHAQAEQKILATVKRFWEDFDAGREPPIDPGQDHDLVKALYPIDDGSTIDLTADNSLPTLVDARKQLADSIREMQHRKDEIETELKGRLGNHSFALLAGGRKLSYKLTKRAAYQVASTEYRSLREIKCK